jgi:hypothetical protein
MKAKFDVKSLVAGALLGAVVIFSAAAARSSRTNWEYKIVAGKVLGNESQLDIAINIEAATGWEFVSANPSTAQWGFAVMRREKK